MKWPKSGKVVPGDFLICDGRSPDVAARYDSEYDGIDVTPCPSCSSSSTSNDVRNENLEASPLEARPLRIVQWNIERGYQLDHILHELRQLDADIITLQELDISCERTKWVNVMEHICTALQCFGVFALEFIEHDSADRSHENRCGKQDSKGTALHGNAILSRKWALKRPRVVPHSWFLDWNTRGHHLKEPRTGFRSFICCELEDSHHVVAVYSLHFEIFGCGPLGRVRQLGDVMADARKLQSHATEHRKAFHVAVGGDFNTIGHSVVRCSKKYHADRMCLLSLGENEAAWLQRKVLARHLRQHTHRGIWSTVNSLWSRCIGDSDFVWTNLYGFKKAELDSIDNRQLCLFDPFDTYLDVTLNNPAYRGLVQGKLDWVLLSNFVVNVTHVFNHEFKASDHKGLMVEVEIRRGSRPQDTYLPKERHFMGETLPYVCVRISIAAVIIGSLMAVMHTFADGF